MRSRAAWLIMLATGLLITGCADPPETPTNGPTETPQVIDGEPFRARLYFPGAGGLLYGQTRDLTVDAANPLELVRGLVEGLILGPEGAADSGLSPALPDGTTVGGVFSLDDTTVLIDLVPAEGAEPPILGSKRELMTVYSLVNTVVLNAEGIERVVLLWQGRQLDTFAGHVDTSRPLTPEISLIAETDA